MKILMSLLFVFPQARGNTGASYPTDIMDLQVSSVLIPELQNISFLFSPPCSLCAGIFKYRNFGLIFDGRNFLDLQIDKEFAPLYMGVRGGVGKGETFRIGYGAILYPIRYFSMGMNFIFSYSFETENYLSNFQGGICGRTDRLKGFMEFSWENALENPGIHLGAGFFPPLFDSLTIFSGIIFKNDMLYPSVGFKYSFSIFDIYFSYGENRIFMGLNIDYKKRVEVKEIVKKVEVVKEVPVYIEKKPAKKKTQPKKIKKKELTEEEKKMAEYHYKKGIEYYKKDMLEEAIKEWEKVIKIDPDYKDVKKYLEETREKVKKLKELR